ncbi:neither inactivation nor afterpotential protein C [Planococcus citri]|uniref:neither inactivation nor afterpotential protein C n=1 Tax=Planococcus citri TaxID=170843 RepID=UPI0031F76262
MPVKGLSGVPTDIQLEALPDPGNRFTLGSIIGTGISGTVYEAVDSESNEKVAIKIQKVIPDYEDDIREEYKILKYLANHPNLPTFLGAFHRKGEVWFALQLCEGGSIIDLVRGLYAQNRHLSEEQIAFVLRESVKAICHLHENHVVHRDIKAKNILLTSNGEIKLVDFGLSRGLKNTLDRKSTCLGSPCWMAPELIISGRNNADGVSSYDNRIDVWALGITALELAEGQAPCEEMHPTRAIFQIVRNPPPTFKLPSKWSQNYADFISECLVKLPEERPFIFEFLEHPFIKSIPDDSSLGQDLVNLKDKVKNSTEVQKPEIHLRNGRLQRKIFEATEAMVVEDLAAVDDVSEDKIMLVLQERFKRGLFYTYIGDILLFVNPNTPIPAYGNKYHCKYQWKSRSDNSPHIYAVADVAYQDMLHHKQPQNIIISGETLSGKTTNYNHLIDHLLYLGKISNKISDKVVAASRLVQTLGNAATPHNNNSTRHVINTQTTYTTTGKLSGAIFYIYQLEKWRVTGYKAAGQGNFHIFYYFYDSVKAKGELDSYFLEDRPYKYLVRKPVDDGNPGGASNDPKKNADKYAEILHLLEVLEFEPDQIEIVQKILAAIILLGDITFKEARDEGSEVENVDIANNVATLLGVDEKKFLWALCNYCVIQKGNAIRKKQTVAHAVEAQAVLARGLYGRLVDFIVNVINLRLSVTRVVLGDKNFISVLDLPGFESFDQNNLEQLFINSTNEQLQYFYNQRIFTWELKEQEEEGIILKPLQFYDNKPTIDELLSKPDGFMYVIDEASRSNSGHSFIIDALANCPRGTRIRKATSTNFTVAHYCKKVEYNAQDIPKKNHDFLPPEMIETLRSSGNFVVKQLFANQFTKSGNLTISTDQNLAIFSGKRKKWGAALVSGDSKSRKFNTEAQGEYSQTRRMRTCSAVYRASSLELLKTLSESTESSSVCFVRCIRAGLPASPGFEADIVSPQLRSLSILDTTRARQIGYSYHVSFKDFIERYKFLAFDFEENVEITRENCRLLLIRLKMEGWIIGKNKVFLRYYDKEFLSRLYETHVKKIVKIQAVMRKFITKRKVIPRVQSQQSIGKDHEIVEYPLIQIQHCTGRPEISKPQKPVPITSEKPVPITPPELKVSVVYSNVKIRGKPANPEKGRRKNQQQSKSNDVRRVPSLLASRENSKMGQKLAMKYAKKWRSKTIYQVLLKYRAKMFEEFANFSQQVHLYNVHVNYIASAQKRQKPVNIQRIDSNQTYEKFIGDPKPIQLRIPFELSHKSMYASTSDTVDSHTSKSELIKEQKRYDTPFKPLQKEERLHCANNRISHVKETETKVDFKPGNTDEDEDEECVYYYHKTGIVEKQRKNLEKSFSVCSVKSETYYAGMGEVETDYSVPASSFGKVFMQLMCPSCCGGLFSETKGSVYMKRPPIRGSKTKSTASAISDVMLEDDENNETDTEYNNRPLSPIPEDQDKPSSPTSPDESNGKPREVRSVSLGDALCQELNQNKSDNGEINWNTKLRKTSLTVGESEQNKQKENTVIELKIRGKEHVEVVKQNGDSDPPFNFQAILRKTSGTRSSLIRKDDQKSENYFKTELLPGVVLQGVIYDL